MSEIINEVRTINELPIADLKAREEIEKLWEAIRSINIPITEVKNND